MTAVTGTRTWATYLDLKETDDWLQFKGTPTGGQLTILQRVIDAACERAQNMANRPFGATEFKERHDGWAGDTIVLHYSPFLRLVKCREYQSSGGFVDLPESTPENPVEGIQIDYATSEVTRTFGGYSWPRPFFPGRRNVEVTYIAGFDPVPADVWTATVDLVAYWWRNTQQTSISSPQPLGSYGEPLSTGNTDLWPGVPNRIADVFESYRLPIG